MQHLDAGSVVLKQQFGKSSRALADRWIDAVQVGAGRRGRVTLDRPLLLWVVAFDRLVALRSGRFEALSAGW